MTCRIRALALSAWTSRAADRQAMPSSRLKSVAQRIRSILMRPSRQKGATVTAHRNCAAARLLSHLRRQRSGRRRRRRTLDAGRSMGLLLRKSACRAVGASRSNGPSGKISTPSANAGSGLYPLVGQRKEHLAVVVGEGRIAGFVTRMDLVPSFRHGRTVFTERQESAIL